MDRIKVGVCGVGAFAQNFIPLFKAHPLVKGMVLCDLDEKKTRAAAEKYGISATCPSLDELCQSDVDAIAIFTQNWMHGPQAVQAMRAGKHVYSAVPSAISIPEITELVNTVKATGKIYMIGETSYYYPSAIYCRDRFSKGDFGRIVYGEAEYLHDFDHALYDVCKWRGGDRWREIAGSPPMFYPTHSTSLIVSVTGAHATHVSCQGYVDNHADGIFRKDVNIWKNEFSNEAALFRMSDGSSMRINEFRRVGHPGTVGMSLYGTVASYEEQVDGQVWVTKNRAQTECLKGSLACGKIDCREIGGAMAASMPEDAAFYGVSKVHPVSRLPKEYTGLPNGHLGSHQFLMDDFVTACVSGKQPSNHAWMAARYLIPGLTAHESAVRGGELLPVPDLGDPPGV